MGTLAPEAKILRELPLNDRDPAGRRCTLQPLTIQPEWPDLFRGLDSVVISISSSCGKENRRSITSMMMAIVNAPRARSRICTEIGAGHPLEGSVTVFAKMGRI